ncbi:MAG TPA: PIN domain-containing protein [Thermoanaerobaculia bacterium]|jgi:predicted nucleic acid-binding protein|nr:PIN domain-containing protein [Thermoanaerobaculia bacterium]
MALPLLIDTSAWVEAMRRQGDEATRNAVHAALTNGRARFCDMVRLELWNGLGDDRERKWLREVEQAVESVPTDATVWREATRLAVEARRKGLSVPATDLLIEACSRVHKLEILHRDSHLDRLASIPPA